MRILLSILLLLVFNALIGQNLKKNWSKVLKGCGQSDIVGKETLFFGPSNTIGLGSVWRKTDKKGYNPRFELVDLIPDEADRNKVVKMGEKTAACSTSTNSLWQPIAELPILGPIFQLTGISAEFHNARKTTISVDSLALDVVKEVQFEQMIKALAAKDPNNAFLKDLLSNPDRLLVTKAYRLTGLAVTLDYDPKTLDSLKSKYPAGGSITLGGDKGVKIGFNYMSNTQLTLKLPSEVYIAGEFSRVTSNGTINLSDSKTIDIQFTAVKVDTTGAVGKIEGLKK